MMFCKTFNDTTLNYIIVIQTFKKKTISDIFFVHEIMRW